MMPLIKKLSEPRIFLSIGLIYTLFVTIIFLLPASEIPNIKISFADKIAHVLIHCVLNFIWLCYCLIIKKGVIFGKNIMLVLVFCLSYGIIIEVFQKWFLPSRTYDVFDVLANVFGSMLGLLLYWLTCNKLGKLFFNK